MTGGKTTIEFQIEEISVLENSGRFPISLVRTGDSSEEVEVSAGLSFVESHYVYTRILICDWLQVMVDTVDGSAVAGEDYIAVHETVRSENTKMWN